MNESANCNVFAYFMFFPSIATAGLKSAFVCGISFSSIFLELMPMVVNKILYLSDFPKKYLRMEKKLYLYFTNTAQFSIGCFISNN